MGHECSAISWIFGQLRGFKTISTAAFATALFGLFAFRLCHKYQVVKIFEYAINRINPASVKQFFRQIAVKAMPMQIQTLKLNSFNNETFSTTDEH